MHAPREKRARRGLPASRDGEDLNALARRLGAQPGVIERPPCVDPTCGRLALDRLFTRLDDLDAGRRRAVRILHLGDSHIAADYITRVIRERLQQRFGRAGRGFVMVDQRVEYGGRRVDRRNWKRTRMVDADGAGMPFGFSGIALESLRPKAEMSFALAPEDDEVGLYYHATPKGPKMEVFAEEESLGEANGRSEPAKSVVARFEIPEHALGRASPPTRLWVVADGAGAKVFGLSFESLQPGVLYDALGPVGADARTWRELDQGSMRAHIEAAAPDLLVLMVGGNDGLAVRKGQRTLADVRRDHEVLIASLKAAAPDADCLLWAPMDAGERVGGKVVSKQYIREIRDLQQQVAETAGCAFWDVWEAMGGADSFGRWLAVPGVMNEDLVHPRAKGGDLLGHLFVAAFLEAYLAAD